VELRYRSREQAEPVRRAIDPYALVSRWGRQYCIGYCHLRQAPRTFLVDRISDLEVQDLSFAEPADFDLDTYLATDPFFQPRVQARLRFGPEAAVTALNNRAYWDTCEEQPDGAVEVTFGAPDLEAAAGLVLHVGFPAAVVEPEALHEHVRARIRMLAAHFDPTDGPSDGRSPIVASEEN
jgi:predicted DNA-binding transcriptional regulator YafY